MTPEINQWALKWGVSYDALVELRAVFRIQTSPIISLENAHPRSESYVQSLVRLEAARKGCVLWRNNVGVLPDETGRPVRYGLGNDSPALNKSLKSGDLIGWRRILINPNHIGHRIAQFISRECKRPDWNYTGTEREAAQLKWAQAVASDGGDACFATGEGTL